MPEAFQIFAARSSHDLLAVKELFRAYEASLDVSLAYQDFSTELAKLPGKYAPPEGELLLARGAGGEAVGCVALRSLDNAARCEMKRLYVAEAGRGVGLGQSLVEELIQVARRIGYHEMWLDTLPSMASAQGLYRKLGFEQAVPYYDTPVVGTVFMRLRLGG